MCQFNCNPFRTKQFAMVYRLALKKEMTTHTYIYIYIYMCLFPGRQTPITHLVLGLKIAWFDDIKKFTTKAIMALIRFLHTHST